MEVHVSHDTFQIINLQQNIDQLQGNFLEIFWILSVKENFYGFKNTASLDFHKILPTGICIKTRK